MRKESILMLRRDNHLDEHEPNELELGKAAVAIGVHGQQRL
jgi:hypothetical protein